MKMKFFDHDNAAAEEESFIEIPVKTKYILCFPPREMLAGNFFSQAGKIFLWNPRIKNKYKYEAAMGGNQEVLREGGERIRIGDMACLFMDRAPETKKWDFFTKSWIDRKIKKYVRRIEDGEVNDGEVNDGQDTVCEIYQMKYRQDYPYSLRLYFAEAFFENLNYGKRTRIGIVEGDTLRRQDIIAFLRRYYDKMNFLIIFSKERSEYRELVEDAWEQYGLAVTVTSSLGELSFCDYILDCTKMPFEGNIRCRKGCFFFSILGDQKKIRSLRKAGSEMTFDSCANILDRTFHNKV